MITINPMKFLQGLAIGIIVSFMVCAVFDDVFILNWLVIYKMIVGGLIGATLRSIFAP